MAIKYVDLDDVYTIKNAKQDILVKVTTGDGQDSAYSVFLGQRFIVSDDIANLGKKKDVAGKKTLITAVIADVLEETNWTSMTVEIFQGDDEPVKYGPYKAKAENHLDTVIFTLQIQNQ
ncbi:hypothetical protein ACWKWU_04240 [Chitinophaga lutea]